MQIFRKAMELLLDKAITILLTHLATVILLRYLVTRKSGSLEVMEHLNIIVVVIIVMDYWATLLLKICSAPIRPFL